MPRLSGTRKIQAAALVLLAGIAVYARSIGPDRGYTGAPGENGDCSACHDTFHEANVGPGSVRISGLPATYEPGQSCVIAITVQDPNRRRWGFQLTAFDFRGLRAGALSPLDSDTQIAQTGIGALDRQYIEHSPTGTYPGTTGGHTWHVQWIAPSPEVGTVQFYLAGNAANNDETNQGDYIYTTSAAAESTSSSVVVTLVSRPDGLTLNPGATFPISWTATNVSNIDSIEVRYSTDDGITFPITNLILSTTNPSATSANWVIPNVTTAAARIRVQAATKLGASVEEISGRFSIGGSQVQNPPHITGVMMAGKSLRVQGNSFLKGAVVEVAGIAIATKNQKDYSHKLKCPNAAKSIPSGATTSITVLNPDGGRSNPFLITRL